MAAISEKDAGGKNVTAFLDMISVSEGTSTSRYTKNDGYDVIVEGIDKSPKIFSDYSHHPGILVTVNNKGLKSTAAGRYQILKKYAEAYQKSLSLSNFGPVAQDKIALQLIRECKALDDIKAGRIREAIAKCSSRWASFPGAGYGQFEHKVDTLLKAYTSAGGVIVESRP